ncbi:nucleotidyltransferase domain-containing protein [Bacillus sp. 3255]|uniref:nucleotidyltransferase domain-containing protein n=1 Tax=Bacillus sp. 3255 TaxID=2817904 RepID=UPI002866941B|nr:nucleotidyltransferase domain-containing protein [Bacillus sp. 3255]MDR6885018.1 putative nucleotidyltransferase [Bacillus sp. 3255]
MEASDVIQKAVEKLRGVEGIAAIVLGGSRACGTETPESDIDIGVYYRPERPIDTAALEQAAAALDDQRRTDLITPIGGWGPWINGGGWLAVGGFAVDILYRDAVQVAGVVDDCLQGRIDIHYQPGHPHGFCTSIYMGEAARCRPLWDPQGVVAELKAKTAVYPDALRHATIAKFLWEADFSLANAKKAESRLDVSYAAGHLFRAVSCLVQVLFAWNGEYLLNEKGAVARCGRMAAAPADFERRVQAGFAGQAGDRAELAKTIKLFAELAGETRELVR